MKPMLRTGSVTTAAIAASLLLSAAAAQAAPPPGIACGQEVAKSMSKCVKKVSGLHAKCYKKTDAACAANDEKIEKTGLKVVLSLQKKCGSVSARDDAGYGYSTYNSSQFGSHFREACYLQSRLVADRTFGTDGSTWTGTDDAGRKCLFQAGKNAGKYISSALKSLSKCDPSACTFDYSADLAKAQTKIDKKCTDLTSLVGTDSATFLASATEQVAACVTSPCDTLDASRCQLPLPNDHFSAPGASTDTGRILAFGPNVVRSDGLGVPQTMTAWNEVDGFSIGAMLVYSDVDVDLTMTGVAPITEIEESLDPATPVVLIDADTGDQQLFWMERDQRGATIDDQVLIGRMARNLEEGKRYIVAMRNMKDGGGLTLDAPAAFQTYRDDIPTEQLPVEARRAHMEDIFTTLEGHGITRASLYMAWDFTTQSSTSVSTRMLTIRDNAFDDILGASAPSFTVDSVINDVDPPRIFRQVDGTFEVPLYLEDGGVPGSALNVDGFGTPVHTGTNFTASFRCLIPYAATTAGGAPAVPARISTYGHGLLGSHTEVSAGNVKDMASEHNFVFCATDWTGFADEDTIFAAQVVTNFNFFPQFIDRQHQGILNQLYLGRLMQHASGFGSDPAFQVGAAESVLDTSELFYDGNSQGGILGGVVAAFSQDVERFVLGVPGINYSTLLHRSVDFDPFEVNFSSVYTKATDRNTLLSLAQVLWDRTDPNGHVNRTLSNPYPGTSAKKVLYQVAFGDHQVAPVTAEIAARSNGMSIHTPVLKPAKVVPETTPYYDIPAIPGYPFDGSALVIWDSGNPAPPTGNIPPAEITNLDPEWGDLEACAQSSSSGDPHSCPRSDADARIQKSEFLKTGGAVVDVCGGAACEAQ